MVKPLNTCIFPSQGYGCISNVFFQKDKGNPTQRLKFYYLKGKSISIIYNVAQKILNILFYP